MAKRAGNGAVRALSSARIDEAKSSEREFIESLKAQVAEQTKRLDVRDAQLQEMLRADAQMKEMLSAKEAQLKEARDEKDALQEERLVLWQKRMTLEREKGLLLSSQAR